MNVLLDKSVFLELCAPIGDLDIDTLKDKLDLVKQNGGRVWVYVGQVSEILDELTLRIDDKAPEVFDEVSLTCSWLAALASDMDVDFTETLSPKAMLCKAAKRLENCKIVTTDPALLETSTNAVLPKDLPEVTPGKGMNFIDLQKQLDQIRPNVEQRLHAVLHHGRFVMGAEITQLESELAEYCGSKHAIACSNGTDALMMGLMALGIGPGDAVITTPFTFFATPEVIALCGATPVFADVDPVTYNLEPARLEAAIEKVKADGKLTVKGIMPVDIFGVPADYDAINAIAEKHGLWVLQDACQSYGAEYKGVKAPSMGTIGATSFFPAKPRGCYGDGGAVFTDDDQLNDVMRSIRVHGYDGGDKYDNTRLGINGRMDTMQAAVLLEKMTLYPEEVAKRNMVADQYAKRLSHVEDLTLPTVPEGCVSVWAQFCVQSPRRAEIQAALQAESIPSPVYYGKSMHLLKAMDYLGYRKGDMPVSEALSENIFALPFHPYLREMDLDRICNTIINA
jgi:UDP-2-acetamido-2-deoxy-ribo-hexuluronate aminotransferase